MLKSPVAILAILSALNLINYLDRYLVVGVGTGLQADLHILDGEFGDVTTAFMWGYFLTSPIFGWLGDRYPRKWLIAAGVAVWSIATAVSGLATSYHTMLAARVVVGIGEASYATLSPTIIDDISSKESKNRWLAIFYVAIPVGSALGFLVGGQLEKYWGWRSAFFIAGGPGILLSLLVLLIREPVRREKEAGDAHAAPRRAAYAELIRLPRYVYTVLGYVAQTVALGGFAAFAVHFLVRKLCFKAETATLAFGVITVVTGLGGTAFGGWLADRIPGDGPRPGQPPHLRVVERRRRAAGDRRDPPAGRRERGRRASRARPSVRGAGRLPARRLRQHLAHQRRGAALRPAERCAPTPWRSSIFFIHLLGDLVSQPPLIGRISDDSDARGSGGEGLQLGMYLLPVALLLSALAWFRGVGRGAKVTRPGTA